MTLRRFFALAVSAFVLTSGTLLVGPVNPAFAAYSCNVQEDAHGNIWANYYGGSTVQPSSSGVSSAGIEAQCLLRYRGFSPGTVDGVFGTNSKNAAKAFQKKVNKEYPSANLDEDGKVGPKTWPYLRNCGIYEGP
jgi:putative peptidoglycan binding protein